MNIYKKCPRFFLIVLFVASVDQSVQASSSYADTDEECCSLLRQQTQKVVSQVQSLIGVTASKVVPVATQNMCSSRSGFSQELIADQESIEQRVDEERFAWIRVESSERFGYYAHFRGMCALASEQSVRSGDDREVASAFEGYGIYGVFVLWRGRYSGKLVLPDNVVMSLVNCVESYYEKSTNQGVNVWDLWSSYADALKIDPIQLPSRVARSVVRSHSEEAFFPIVSEENEVAGSPIRQVSVCRVFPVVVRKKEC